MDGFSLRRPVDPGRYPLASIARGLDRSPVLHALFPTEAELRGFLEAVEIEVEESDGYCWVDDTDGHVVVCAPYLNSAEEVYLYLDLCHELVHVKQWREGREIYDRRYPYVERPTELEAWKLTIQEARRLALGDAEIAEYLRLDWVSAADHERFLRALGVGRPQGGSAGG
jgi:hypothetical protein